MDPSLGRYLNLVRILWIRYRLRGKLIDLQALSAQQISDLYLGDAILGQIRTLQKQLEACIQGEVPLPPRVSQTNDEIK